MPLLFFAAPKRDSKIEIHPAGGRVGIAGLDGDASLRFAGGKSATSPFRRTISSVHNGFDRFGHSIFFFSNFTDRNGICMYKFPACYGIGQQRTVHFKHNQLTVE